MGITNSTLFMLFLLDNIIRKEQRIYLPSRLDIIQLYICLYCNRGGFTGLWQYACICNAEQNSLLRCVLHVNRNQIIKIDKNHVVLKSTKLLNLLLLVVLLILARTYYSSYFHNIHGRHLFQDQMFDRK